MSDYKKIGGGGGGLNGPSSATDGNMVVFDGATGKRVKDGGAPSGTGDVQGPASATVAEIALYTDATGKKIKTSQVTISASNAIKTPGSLWTDTIYEKTAASGVTIDGMLVKDSVPRSNTVLEKTADTGVTVDGVLIKDGAIAKAVVGLGNVTDDAQIKASIGTTKGDLISFTGAGAPSRIPVATDGYLVGAKAAATWGVAYIQNNGTAVGLGSVTNDAQIAKSVGTAKGDLIAFTGANVPARLPVATDGYLVGAKAAATWGVAYIQNNGTAVGLGSVTNDAQVKASIGTTKGDLISFTGSGAPVRVGVGADSSSLQSLAAATAGVRWVAAGGGAGDVTGPASSTAALIPVFSDATGKDIDTRPVGIDPQGTIYPTTSYISRLGTATKSFTELHLNENWSTVGGSIYFDGGGSRYIQEQSGLGLLVDGMPLTIYANDLNVRLGNVSSGNPYAGPGVVGFSYVKLFKTDNYVRSLRYKKSITNADFSVAGTTASISLMAVPAGATIRDIYFNVSSTFAGGAISAYTLKIGQFGSSATKLFLANNVYNPVGLRADHALKGQTLNENTTTILNMAATSTLMITADSTGANLSAATKGAADVYVCYDHVYNDL